MGLSGPTTGPASYEETLSMTTERSEWTEQDEAAHRAHRKAQWCRAKESRIRRQLAEDGLDRGWLAPLEELARRQAKAARIRDIADARGK
jgi:hypothetical protein